jgi:hypothetical protein
VFKRETPEHGDPEPVVYSLRPHGGAFSTPATVGDKLTDPRETLAGDRSVLTATATARSAGDYAIVAWARGRTVRVSVRRF